METMWRNSAVARADIARVYSSPHAQNRIRRPPSRGLRRFHGFSIRCAARSNPICAMSPALPGRGRAPIVGRGPVRSVGFGDDRLRADGRAMNEIGRSMNSQGRPKGV